MLSVFYGSKSIDMVHWEVGVFHFLSTFLKINAVFSDYIAKFA